MEPRKGYKKRKIITSARAREENGVSGGGLITAVHPAASAAASLRVIMAEGKFHGVRIELKIDLLNSKKSSCIEDTYTTPMGCLITRLRLPGNGLGICSAARVKISCPIGTERAQLTSVGPNGFLGCNIGINTRAVF